MTLEEVKDSLDKICQDYPFMKTSEVLIEIGTGITTKHIGIFTIETDKYCRPLIILDI